MYFLGIFIRKATVWIAGEKSIKTLLNYDLISFLTGFDQETQHVQQITANERSAEYSNLPSSFNDEPSFTIQPHPWRISE